MKLLLWRRPSLIRILINIPPLGPLNHPSPLHPPLLFHLNLPRALPPLPLLLFLLRLLPTPLIHKQSLIL